MFWDTLISVAVEILKFINWVLGFFSLPYISQMTGAVQWAVNLIWMFNGLFPVDTLTQCLFVLLLVYFFRFQIRLAFETIFPLIPIIGKRIQLPHWHDGAKDDFNQPYFQSVRPDEGNKNGMGTFHLYKRRKVR